MTSAITALTALVTALSRYWIVSFIIVVALMLVLVFKDDGKPLFSAEEAIDRKLDEIKRKKKKSHDMEYESWLYARYQVIDDLRRRVYESDVKLAESCEENDKLKAENDALKAENKTLEERLSKLRESPMIETETIEAVDGRGNIIFRSQVDQVKRTSGIYLSYKQVDSLVSHRDFVLVDNLLSRKDGMVGAYMGIPVYCTEWIGGGR